MICPSCKTSVPDGNAYCLNCGQYLGEPTVVRPSPQGSPRLSPSSIRVPFESLSDSAVPLPTSSRLPWLIAGAALTGLFAVLLLVAAYFLFATDQQTQQANAPLTSPSPRAVISQPLATPFLEATPSPKPTREAQSPSEIPIQQPERQPPTSESGQNPWPSSSEPKPVSQRIRIVDGSFEVRPGQMTYYRFTLNTLARASGDFQASGGRNDISTNIVDETSFAALYRNSPFRPNYSSYGYVSYGQIDVVLRPGTYYAVFDNRRSILTPKMVTAHLYADPQ